MTPKNRSVGVLAYGLHTDFKGEQVLIGGNEPYISPCRLHYKPGEAGILFNNNILFNKDTNALQFLV